MLLVTPLALGVHSALGQSSTVSEELVVVGERVIQSRSLDAKRRAESIVEVVTTDGIRALPDGNPAEALRRLPGVYALDDQGEGRYASIRGIDPELMNVTLNGQPIGSPEGGGSGGSAGRAVRMDSIPAELVSGIEVVKAVTPDMNHNAIGGGINISMASPFDRDGTYHFGRVAYGNNDSSGDSAWGGSGTYGKKFGDAEQWGLLVSGSFEERMIASQRMSSDRWQPVGELFLPSELSLFDYLVERKRWGTNLALEHRPSDDDTLKFNVSYNRHSDDEDRWQTGYEFRRGDVSEQTETSGRYSGGRVTREFRWYLQEDTIATASVAGEHFFGDSQLDWSVGYSLAEKDTPRRIDWEFRSGTNDFPNRYDLAPLPYRVLPEDVDAYMDPSNYPFRRVRRRIDTEREEIYSAEANLRRDVTLGERSAYWKVGASALLRDKLQDRSNDNYVGGDEFTLGDFALSTPDIPGFFDGHYIFGPALDIAALERFFVDSPQYFSRNEEATILDSTGSDYDGSEDVLATYGMLGVELGKVDLLGGVRVERTRADYAADEILFEDGSFTGQIRRLSDSNGYTNVFPGLHVRFNATDNFVMRGSLTSTIGRQPFGALSPAREFSVIEGETQGSLVGSVGEGNPDLEPYEARNYDLSFEFYPDAGGIYSIALFRKDIDNAIYTYGFQQENVEFEGFYFERLDFSRPENADAGRIDGIELNVQRFFDFLPAPFDGFGVGLNYTYAKSSLEVASRPGETLPYVRQPRDIGNLALMYEKNKILARIAMTYAGSYLTGVSAGPETDSYRYRRKPVDARVSYQFTPKVSAFVNVRNITDAADENYSGRPERRTAHESYSWSAWMGVNWRL